MGAKSHQIWYASEQRARSATKFIVYDDIGTLSLGNNRIEFAGPRIDLAIATISNVMLRHQRWNWVAYLLVNLAVSPFYLFWYVVVLWFGGRWEYVVFGAVVLNAIGVAIGYSVTWVVVDGEDQTRRPVRAWFADGARRGWRGIFGGTKQLYEQVVAMR